MTSYGLPSDPGKYCIVVNYVVFEANKIKFKPTQCKIDIAIISEDGKTIQTGMKHLLLLLLRNALKHNSIKLSAARLHVSSKKF